MNSIFDIVQTLCNLGYSVIPSGRGKEGKSPDLNQWKKYQDKPPTEAIHNTWRYNLKPKLYGIVTGKVSGVIVVDCDSAEAVLVMGDLKPHVRTPRGGCHYYFGYPGHHVKTQAGILPKIDIRADGGFANVIGANPVTGGEYHIEIMPAPETIYPWDKMPKAITGAMDKPASESAPRVEIITLVPEGERNDWLFRRACGYRNKGDPEETIFKKVKIDYEDSCEHNPPMGDEELRSCCHSAAEYEPGSDALKLLPFVVKRLIQYGAEDAEVTLELEDGVLIDMGETSAFLTARRARNKLWERGYTLSATAIKRWTQITNALRALAEIQPTVTALEETEQWLRNHLTTRYSRILMIDTDDPERDSLSKALTLADDGIASVIRDKDGRVYLSLNAIISHARMTLGQNLTQKALATRLRKIGFEKAGVSSDYSGGKHSRVRMWMSPVGFLPPSEDKERLVPPDIIDQVSEAIAEEERSPLDKAARKIRREI